MRRRAYEVGDLVVFSKEKCGSTPGPRARNLIPARHGDTYSYRVNKYWIVLGITEDRAHIELATRRGKRNMLDSEHPLLRRATWWERLFLRHRFPPRGIAGDQPPSVKLNSFSASTTKSQPV